MGLFRYWTLSNLPLFLIAAPVLALMIISVIEPIQNHLKIVSQRSGLEIVQSISKRSEKDRARDKKNRRGRFERACRRRLAYPQLALVTLTFLSFHVQIINRLSSGYPLWYMTISEHIVDREMLRVGKWRLNCGKAALSWFIVYSIVQAGLYASFLPPA